MLQRGVSLLVLIGFAASQLATVGHAHAWTSLPEQQQHDATPHVHWFGSSSHRHEHTHGGHSHPHKRGQSNSSQDRDDATPTPGQTDFEHDASAIFISACLALPVTGNPPVLLMGVNEPSVVPVSLVQEIEAHVWLLMCMHPPDASWPGSHLYLSLRNLRI
jgi:hypothetical protein